MTRDRIPWKQYFMMQALVIAQRSTCDRALVGSVLVKDDRMIATGYNGSCLLYTSCHDLILLDSIFKIKDAPDNILFYYVSEHLP